MSYDEKNHYVFASEDPNVVCESFCGENFEFEEKIWTMPGGCMSIVQVSENEKSFLAIQEFYMKVSPSLAKVVLGKKKDGVWDFKDVLKLPYVHRFDIYSIENVNYFICATLAKDKKNKEDWSTPGAIYVGELSEDLERIVNLKILKDGMFKNHGYCRDYDDGKILGYFGCDDGIYKVTPPYSKAEDWKIEKVFSGCISEIAVIDIDMDGEKEFMTIEPFHGDSIYIYKKINGKYERVYRYNNEINFAHSLIAGNLRGTPTFIAGVRRNDSELFCVQHREGEFITEIIDTGGGPANLFLVNEGHRDLILSANHTSNEAIVYIITD